MVRQQAEAVTSLVSTDPKSKKRTSVVAATEVLAL